MTKIKKLTVAQMGVARDLAMQVRDELTILLAKPSDWDVNYSEHQAFHALTRLAEVLGYSINTNPAANDKEAEIDALREAMRITGETVKDEIDGIVQSVNEWDDRTSPEDYPDHLLITSEELTEILTSFAAALKGDAQ